MYVAPSSPVCEECGLCCNGSFFAQFTLEPEEVGRINKIGLPIVDHDGRKVIKLGCTRYTGTGCGIYEDRPKVCALYRCRLLNDVDDGTVTRDEASMKIARLKALAQKLKAWLPVGTADESLFHASKGLGEGDADVAWRHENADVVMDMALFLRLSHRDFGVGDDDYRPRAVHIELSGD
jgi:Fe-S-cluster containining protein